MGPQNSGIVFPCLCIKCFALLPRDFNSVVRAKATLRDRGFSVESLKVLESFAERASVAQNP